MVGLAPLCRGKTALVAGPSEVPLAKTLLELGKELPNFFVMGAVLQQERMLQVRERASAAQASEPRQTRETWWWAPIEALSR